MTKEELDFIGSMNMCDEISNEAYKKIVNHIEETEISDDCVSRIQALSAIRDLYPNAPFIRANWEKWREKNKKYIECEDIIKALPPVTPTQCIAAIRFNKEDLREICNERIEIACEHGTCKDCKHWDKEGEYCSHLSNYNGWFEDEYYQVYTESDFYCADFEKRGVENG
jgi:hypothetical protein